MFNEIIGEHAASCDRVVLVLMFLVFFSDVSPYKRGYGNCQSDIWLIKNSYIPVCFPNSLIAHHRT